MADLHWYVAYVRSCQELKIAERLGAKGIEVYVPVQKVKRKWSDRVKLVDRLVLPGLVFIHCTEEVRVTVFGLTYGICYFLMDKTNDEPKVLTVQEKQMEDFIRVVRALNGEDEISVVDYRVEPGDMVRVIRGPLAGFICECVEVQNRHKLIIRLGMVGAALVSVEISDIVKEG